MSAEGDGELDKPGDQYLPMKAGDQDFSTKDGDHYLPMKAGDQDFSTKDGDMYLPMKAGDQDFSKKDGDHYLPMDNDATGHLKPHPGDTEHYAYVDLSKPRALSSAMSQPHAPDNTRRTTSFSPAHKPPLKATPSSDMYVYQEHEASLPRVNDYEVPVTNEYELPTDAQGLMGSQTYQRVKSPATETTI